jgi:hypothetical protein
MGIPSLYPLGANLIPVPTSLQPTDDLLHRLFPGRERFVADDFSGVVEDHLQAPIPQAKEIQAYPSIEIQERKERVSKERGPGLLERYGHRCWNVTVTTATNGPGLLERYGPPGLLERNGHPLRSSVTLAV